MTEAGPSIDSLGDRVRRLREKAGLTKTALAAGEYTVSYVSQIESGRRRPSRDALRFFARRLGVSEEWLLTGIPDGLERRLAYELEDVQLLLWNGRAAEAEERVRSALQQARGYGLARIEAKANVAAGSVCLRQGRMREAIDRYEEALEGDLPERDRGLVTATLARAYESVGDLAYATQLLESFLLEARRDHPLDPGAVAELQTVLVSLYFERGDMLRAERAAQRALAAASESVAPQVRANAFWGASRVLAESRRWEEALDLATRARVITEELGDRRRLAGIHRSYAFLCLESEPARADEAERHLDAAEALLADDPPTSHLAYLYTERSRLALVRSRAADALGYSSRALEHVGEDQLERGRALFLSGRALAQLERREEAIDALHEAATAFEKSGARQQQASCWREIGELELAAGDVDAGVDALRAGLQALEPGRSRA